MLSTAEIQWEQQQDRNLLPYSTHLNILLEKSNFIAITIRRRRLFALKGLTKIPNKNIGELSQEIPYNGRIIPWKVYVG